MDLHDDSVCIWCGAETVPPKCLWTEDREAVWQTQCGQSFVFEDGGSPAEHKFKYCAFCGGKLTEAFA